MAERYITIFLLVDACVGLNWLLVSFLSHVNKNIIHSYIVGFSFTIRSFLTYKVTMLFIITVYDTVSHPTKDFS